MTLHIPAAATDAEYVAWLATLPQEKPSLDERLHDAEHLLPELRRNSLALAPAMLRSGLFPARTGARVNYDEYTALPALAGYKVELLGRELRQDDERVLACLIKERAGMSVGTYFDIVPRTFVKAIGWPDNGASVQKLRDCIEHLHAARVRITHPNGGISLYSFVADANLENGSPWRIWLSPRLLEMFRSSVTYLAANERLAMRDGLTSWLYGAIKADACLAPFALSDLRDMSGLFFYEPRDFNRRLRSSLDELRTLGVIDGYELRRGSVTVHKPAGKKPTKH